MASTTAIISDIHANLEALTAVLEDIATHGVERVYCLGDVVGHGPNPCECIDIAMAFAVCTMGNHDKLALEGDAESPLEQQATQWTRRQLSVAVQDVDAPDRRREFLRGLPPTYREQGTLYLHGSPRDPLNEFMFPESIFDRQKMASIFSLVDGCCFMGHTHLPGIFTPDCEFFTPDQIDGKWPISVGTKTMCNVGSVGQPRDDDHRACYCLFDGDTVRFRRVEYDVDATSRKIKNLFPPQ